MVRSRMPMSARIATQNGQAKCEITLVRIAPGTFDDDNLIASFKAIRDGVADGVGVKDNDPNIEFWYEQRRNGQRFYAIHIEIRMRPT